MKTNVKNLLRGGVFVIAAAFAFAFTQPKPIEGYATMDNGVTWIDLSDPTVNYSCERSPNENCIYAEPDITSPVLVQGKFELLP